MHGSWNILRLVLNIILLYQRMCYRPAVYFRQIRAVAVLFQEGRILCAF
jgi:hypothetical protein